MKNTLTVDGIEYQRVSPNGNRAVVVVDRGWIFAGDVTEKDGRIFLDRAVWVFRWQSVGFAAVVEDPKKAKADLRAMSTRVDIPANAEIFRLPVDDNWGL
jgi:hypothetical protein